MDKSVLDCKNLLEQHLQQLIENHNPQEQPKNFFPPNSKLNFLNWGAAVRATISPVWFLP